MPPKKSSKKSLQMASSEAPKKSSGRTSKKAPQKASETLATKSPKRSERLSQKALQKNLENVQNEKSEKGVKKTSRKSSNKSLKPSSKVYQKSGENQSKPIVLASQKNSESKSKAVVRSRSTLCLICKKSFTSKKKLNDHNAKHHFFRHCPNCPKTFRQTRKFILHLQSHLGIHPYECKICLLGFNRKRDLFDHKKMHKNPRKLKCEMCSEIFPHRASLNRHRLVHDGPPYACSHCSTVFSKATDRTYHLKNHVYRCTLCTTEVVAFPLAIELASHMCDVHQIEDGDQKPCISNGAVNLDEDSGSDSMEDTPTSDGEESDTDVDSNYRADAVKPVYSLKRKNNFICFICYDLYPSCELLKSHMKAHKWYPCDSCSRYFPDYETLEQHECNLNVSSFSDDGALEQYEYNNFKVPSFICKTCNTETKCENCSKMRNGFSEVSNNVVQSLIPRYQELPSCPVNYSNAAECNSLFKFIDSIKSQTKPLDVQVFNHVGFHTLCLKEILKNPRVRSLFPAESISCIRELYSQFKDLGQILCNRMNCSLTQ